MKRKMKLEVVWKSDKEMDAEEKKQLNMVYSLAFRGEESENDEDNIEWQQPFQHFLGKIDGVIISNVGIVPREITVAGRKVMVGGIGGVATHPEFQRRGFARILMEKVGEHLRKNKRRFDYGMLFCEDKLVKYYEHYGWFKVMNPIFTIWKNERKLIDEICMVLLLSEKMWPEGEVDTLGPPW